MKPLRCHSLRFAFVSSASLALLAAPWSTVGQPFWPQFRGPMGQGVSTSARPPVTFSRTNALWSTEVPPGHSSPVVWGDKIFFTCIEGEARLSHVSLSNKDGQNRD